MKRYRVIGLMSGTSADGVDAAWLETDGLDHVVVGPEHSRPYADHERAAIRAAYAAARGPEAEPVLARAANLLTLAHIEAVSELAKICGPVDLIGFHGQTVLHDPANRRTLQIGEADLLAAQTGIPVVHDFRSADVAAGGQGAPFAPLYHAALAKPLAGPLAVLNLGGVANLTFIDGDTILAADVGPANALIDDLILQRMGGSHDEDGAIAARGRVDRRALEALLDNPWFARPFPKSLDRNAFSATAVDGLSLENAAATLTEFTAAAVALAARQLPAKPRRWLVTGGGRHNKTLMAALARHLGDVAPVESVGWRGDSLEAEAFAYLAVRSIKGLPLSLPGTTGVPTPITGGRLTHPSAWAP